MTQFSIDPPGGATSLQLCATDGVFSLDPHGTLRFHPVVDLPAAAVSAVQRRIRSRVLHSFVRHGTLTAEEAADLTHWDHGGGFSLHARNPPVIEADSVAMPAFALDQTPPCDTTTP